MVETSGFQAALFLAACFSLFVRKKDSIGRVLAACHSQPAPDIPLSAQPTSRATTPQEKIRSLAAGNKNTHVWTSDIDNRPGQRNSLLALAVEARSYCRCSQVRLGSCLPAVRKWGHIGSNQPTRTTNKILNSGFSSEECSNPHHTSSTIRMGLCEKGTNPCPRIICMAGHTPPPFDLRDR